MTPISITQGRRIGLASIGFTFSLFFATAVFPVGPILVEAKLGALLTVGGAVTACAAAALLRVGRFAAGSPLRTLAPWAASAGR